MISVIAFSKNRPLQIHAYIESLLYFSDVQENQISIIYSESSGITYQKVISTFNGIKWIKEELFIQDVMKCINSANDVILFGSDNVIFTQRFRLDDIEMILKNEKTIWGFNLGLGKNIEHSSDIISGGDFCAWNWNLVQNEHFRCLWKVGCIAYRKEDIVDLLTNIDSSAITNLNELEIIPTGLTRKLAEQKNMCSYIHSKAVFLNTGNDSIELQVQNDIFSEFDVYELFDLYNDKNIILDILKVSEVDNSCIYLKCYYFIQKNYFREENSSIEVYKDEQLKAGFEIDKMIYRKRFLKNNNYIFSLNDQYLFPCLYDKEEEAGLLDPHYFMQDIYMAKKIYQKKPIIHFDIGSRVDGFIAHLLAFEQKVTLIDIRPLSYDIEGLSFIQGNATNLENISDNSLSSLSSLHAIEHFGLGRYGDPIDPDGWKKALLSMQRVMRKGGILYVSVPVGTEDRLYFNAHRMFDIRTIPAVLFDMELIEFSYIDNYEVFHVEHIENAIVYKDYLCGMYIFKKK